MITSQVIVQHLICLTSPRRACSLFCSVHNPFEISIREITPSWEPLTTLHPVSCTWTEHRASSRTWKTKKNKNRTSKTKTKFFHRSTTELLDTLTLRVGSFCLNKMSQMSSTPSIFTVKKSEGLTGLQQASVKYAVWCLLTTKPGHWPLLKYIQDWSNQKGVNSNDNDRPWSQMKTDENIIKLYLVHMIDDSLMSSDQIRAPQSPTVRKFWEKKGFFWMA